MSMTPEQVLAQLQQTVAILQGQMITLSTNLDESRAEVVVLREQSRVAYDKQTARMDSNGRNHRNRLVDSKSAKPDIFVNDRNKFKHWSRRTKAYCNGLTPGMRKAMVTCEQAKEPIDEKFLDENLDLDDIAEIDS